ncbi:MAG TPA: DUF6458 family protein [Acidimicrobiia bacterium]|nr:DUF6458 family protein [Acidimicrobiia bacterium]
MAFGTSIFLIAVGAVLTYAIEADVEGVNLDAVGVILMIVGIIGFIVSALFFASWAPFNDDRRGRVVREREYDRV